MYVYDLRKFTNEPKYNVLDPYWIRFQAFQACQSKISIYFFSGLHNGFPSSRRGLQLYKKNAQLIFHPFLPS
jgi:hypothetical protein